MPPPTKPLPTRTTSTRNLPPTQPPKKPPLKPSRPTLHQDPSTIQTRYMTMLLEQPKVPILHNILSAIFVWIILAGYIVFPATFNKFQRTETLDKHRILSKVQNVHLLYVAAFACGIGVLGCVWLWWKWRKNYLWVINRIFFPTLMNSLAGLISTLVNVYSAQDGQYSVTARATVIVTAACSVCAVALLLLYNCVMLGIVKRRHDKETRVVGQGGVHAEERGKEKDKGVDRNTVRDADSARVV